MVRLKPHPNSVFSRPKAAFQAFWLLTRASFCTDYPLASINLTTMRQSHKVQPTPGLSPISKPHNRHLTPVSTRPKPRKRSAPPISNPQSDLTPQSSQEVEKVAETEGKEQEEGYTTVPIAYKYVQTNPLKSKLPSFLRLTGSTKTPSLDSESPLVEDRGSSPSMHRLPSGLKYRQRLSTISTLASQSIKKPCECNLTICDEGEIPGSGRPLADDMAASTRAKATLLSEKGPNVLEELAVAVPTSYPQLDLSKKGLKDADLQQIVRLLEVYPYATDLDLYGNKMNFSLCDEIVFGSSHQHIRKLTLSGNSLGRLPAHTVLGQFLAVFSSLEVLEMAECGITDDDFFRLYATLSSFPKLKFLQLKGNSISDTSVLLVYQICKLNHSIRSIDLRKNPFRGQNLRFPQHTILTDGPRKCCERCSLQ